MSIFITKGDIKVNTACNCCNSKEFARLNVAREKSFYSLTNTNTRPCDAAFDTACVHYLSEKMFFMIGENIIRKSGRWRNCFNWNTKKSCKYDERKFHIYKRNFNSVNVDEVETKSSSEDRLLTALYFP